MTDRLAAAKAELAAGRREGAVAVLEAAVAEGPQSAVLWRMLAAQLFNLGRFAEAGARASEGLAAHPGDYDLTNTLGVALRRQKRLPEAVTALEAAAKLRPGSPPAWQNLANVLLELDDRPRAERVLLELARLEPAVAAHPWRRGRLLWREGRTRDAVDAMREALARDPDLVDARLDLATLLQDEHRPDEALAALDAGIARAPREGRLQEAKVTLLRRHGRRQAAEDALAAAQALEPAWGWPHYQRGQMLDGGPAALSELERAHSLEPQNRQFGLGLAEALSRDRSAREGASLDRAYRLALELLPRNADPGAKVLSEVLGRACDFDALDRVGSFRDVGRAFAGRGRHSGLLLQIPRVKDDADRLELLEQHRIWGRNTEAWAARAPIARPPPRPRDAKLRLGFLSSDLRQHAVGYFALPLFEHRDPRFELFVYSFYGGPEDPVQAKVRGAADGFRLLGAGTAREAAQAIADDRLDLLVELGGSTRHNRIEVMAFAPAPRLASWLGYPHSVGLSGIDWLICDPLNAPERADLLIERPLKLPHTWITLGEHAFTDDVAVAEAPPSARNGFVTFGTANNPYKYNPQALGAWARMVAAVPDSRFMVVRPEAGSQSFRTNIERAFAAHGVTAERLIWRAVRGGHLPHYNDMDISLDTFPLTGGTTTTESLWMGVPVVSLAGPAFYERLSRSILTNAGLGDLVASDLDGYHRTAVALAADEARRRDLRRTLRASLRAGPLGRTADFARDFYETLWTAVRG